MALDANTLKVAADSSAQLITWALALAGGSVVVIVSTDCVRPTRAFRKAYLFFLPAWAFVALSVNHGVAVSQHYMAAVFGKAENLSKIFLDINTGYAEQLEMLQISLFFFGCWLVLFLLWWIFFSDSGSGSASSAPGSLTKGHP